MEVHGDTRRQYVEFAADAVPDSPCFAEWARGVADDPEVLAWLERLPVPKRQPNLVFAAARWHDVPAPGPYAGLRRALLADDGGIEATIRGRATQTNEVGRLATLLPAFDLLEATGPIALVEVGPSAGLCLYPDRYDYAWATDAGTVRLRGPGAGRPELTCRVDGPAPLPTALPEVAHRTGVDLNPLDVTDPDQMAWLANLVWPEDDGRRAQLVRAVGVARADPPRLLRGDLLTELPALVDAAAAYGTVVVFHSAVIAYLDDDDRARFASMMTGLVAEGRCRWVSNEAPRVLPGVTGLGPAMPPDVRGFVLGVDGRAVAWTHGHGRWLRWLA
ncbi:DUF2332 domain-containing protein [Nocardioides sp. YIM 152315]|uniref:DUF2332 domain-containing protein n=1 Tax=Nocardioides sp. YIM 152315 TaxID=3031760 RepID=UPI0023DA7938|nr:DUF2332 domain-containing protein [Nocardioides sp. YIM 152315]MDF1604368.1 DUF2332 domain-containing protein [Nocardioides sp. YIM 152315]